MRIYFIMLLCLILSQPMVGNAQTPATSSLPVSNISAPASPSSTPQPSSSAAAKDDVVNPGLYEEHQSICRKNEYDLPSTLTASQKEKRIAAIKNKIQSEPNQLKWKYQLLREYIYQRDKASATELVNNLADNKALETEFKVFKSALAFFERSKALGRDELIKITIDNPRHIEALRLLAELYKAEEAYFEAATVYLDLAKLTKTSFDEQLCELYVQQSLFLDAEKSCLKASKLNSKNPFPLVFLGVLARETNKLKPAEQHFKESLKLGKTEMALVCLGELSALQKDFSTAAEFYKQAQKEKPMSTRAVLGQAWAEIYSKKYIEALNSFKAACSKDRKYLVEFRKAAKHLAEIKNENTQRFVSASQQCAEH